MADSLWIRLIHARRVTGCHAAPPCETFTAARWLPAPEGLKPRPLRDSDFPWCKTFISLSEVAQCITGNLLMYKALFLVLLVHIHGGSTTLEHPRGDPSDARKWCIWDAAFLRELLLDRDFDLLPFLQGPLGRPFSKPTQLLVGRLKGLSTRIFEAYDHAWRPTQVLGGQTNGVWNARQAKEYPVKLCEILAKAHIDYAEHLEYDEESSLPEDLPQALSQAFRSIFSFGEGQCHGQRLSQKFHGDHLVRQPKS